MNETHTPITDAEWATITDKVEGFTAALRMRQLARQLERQRAELLGALENILHHQPQLIGPGVSEAKSAIAKAKGTSHD